MGINAVHTVAMGVMGQSPNLMQERGLSVLGVKWKNSRRYKQDNQSAGLVILASRKRKAQLFEEH